MEIYYIIYIYVSVCVHIRTCMCVSAHCSLSDGGLSALANYGKHVCVCGKHVCVCVCICTPLYSLFARASWTSNWCVRAYNGCDLQDLLATGNSSLWISRAMRSLHNICPIYPGRHTHKHCHTHTYTHTLSCRRVGVLHARWRSYSIWYIKVCVCVSPSLLSHPWSSSILAHIDLSHNDLSDPNG